jgi:hypothetical protein
MLDVELAEPQRDDGPTHPHAPLLSASARMVSMARRQMRPK